MMVFRKVISSFKYVVILDISLCYISEMEPKFETWWWLPVRNKKIPFGTRGVKNGAVFNMEKGKL